MTSDTTWSHGSKNSVNTYQAKYNFITKKHIEF